MVSHDDADIMPASLDALLSLRTLHVCFADYTRFASHYQWVIFIVVMLVGLTSLWIGACVWHRRYLRKKDRQYALSNIRASTGAASGTTGLNVGAQDDDLGRDGARTPHDAAGAFAPGSFDNTEKRRSNFLGRRF